VTVAAVGDGGCFSGLSEAGCRRQIGATDREIDPASPQLRRADGSSGGRILISQSPGALRISNPAVTWTRPRTHLGCAGRA